MVAFLLLLHLLFAILNRFSLPIFGYIDHNRLRRIFLRIVCIIRTQTLCDKQCHLLLWEIFKCQCKNVEWNQTPQEKRSKRRRQQTTTATKSGIFFALWLCTLSASFRFFSLLYLIFHSDIVCCFFFAFLFIFGDLMLVILLMKYVVWLLCMCSSFKSHCVVWAYNYREQKRNSSLYTKHRGTS